MRDGIYKNLPLPTRWQAVLKSCTLDAERGAIAREKVERAIGQILREIRPQFMKALREKTKLTESLLPVFRVFDVEVTSRDLAGQNCPFENEIIAQARRHEDAGMKGAKLEREAYMSAIEEHAERCKRQMEQTILTSESDRESKATISAVRNAFDTARIVPLVDALLAGDSLDLPPAQRRIDLDEDLSRPTP